MKKRWKTSILVAGLMLVTASGVFAATQDTVFGNYDEASKGVVAANPMALEEYTVPMEAEEFRRGPFTEEEMKEMEEYMESQGFTHCHDQENDRGGMMGYRHGGYRNYQ